MPNTPQDGVKAFSGYSAGCIQHLRYHHESTSSVHARIPSSEVTIRTDQSAISTPPRTPQSSASNLSIHPTHSTTQQPLSDQHIPNPPLQFRSIQDAALLDNRHPLWCLKRHARCLWGPRPQATHRGSGAHCELGDCGAVSSNSSPPLLINPISLLVCVV